MCAKINQRARNIRFVKRNRIAITPNRKAGKGGRSGQGKNETERERQIMDPKNFYIAIKHEGGLSFDKVGRERFQPRQSDANIRNGSLKPCFI